MTGKLTRFPAFAALSAAGFLFAASAAAQTVLAPTSPAPVEVTVYKCYLKSNGLRTCDKIAGASSTLKGAIEGAAILPGGLVETNGRSANCRVVGTGPGYAIIVCG